MGPSNNSSVLSGVKSVERSAEEQNPKIKKVLNLIIDWFPIVTLLVVAVFFYIMSEGKLATAYNIQVLLNQSFLYILGGLGVSFLFAQGTIDLSMGSTLGLAAILGTYASQVHPLFGVAVALLVGLAVGSLCGFLYSSTGIPVFVIGLSMSFLISGTLLPILNNSLSIRVDPALMALKSNTLEIVVIIVMILIIGYFFNYTTFGKHSKALGASGVAAAQSGVNIKRVKFLAFVVSGLMAGFIALMSMIRTGAAGSDTGSSFHFNVMIAMVLGGMPVSGGSRSKLRSAIIGSLTVAILSNGMVLWGISSRVQEIVKGVIFLIVVVSTNKIQEKLRS